MNIDDIDSIYNMNIIEFINWLFNNVPWLEKHLFGGKASDEEKKDLFHLIKMNRCSNYISYTISGKSFVYAFYEYITINDKKYKYYPFLTNFIVDDSIYNYMHTTPYSTNYVTIFNMFSDRPKLLFSTNILYKYKYRFDCFNSRYTKNLDIKNIIKLEILNGSMKYYIDHLILSNKADVFVYDSKNISKITPKILNNGGFLSEISYEIDNMIITNINMFTDDLFNYIKYCCSLLHKQINNKIVNIEGENFSNVFDLYNEKDSLRSVVSINTNNIFDNIYSKRKVYSYYNENCKLEFNFEGYYNPYIYENEIYLSNIIQMSRNRIDHIKFLDFNSIEEILNLLNVETNKKPIKEVVAELFMFLISVRLTSILFINKKIKYEDLKNIIVNAIDKHGFREVSNRILEIIKILTITDVYPFLENQFILHTNQIESNYCERFNGVKLFKSNMIPKTLNSIYKVIDYITFDSNEIELVYRYRKNVNPTKLLETINREIKNSVLSSL